MTLESRPFSSSQIGEKRERSWKMFASNSRTVSVGAGPTDPGGGEIKKVGFTGPDDDKEKYDPIAESVDTLLHDSKMVFCAAAIADCSFLTVPSGYAQLVVLVIRNRKQHPN